MFGSDDKALLKDWGQRSLYLWVPVMLVREYIKKNQHVLSAHVKVETDKRTEGKPDWLDQEIRAN